MFKTLVVIPTYNEKENLPLIIEAVFNLQDDFTVLIIDDNSPDQTGEIAEKLKKKYAKLQILHRQQKEGLGKAYLDGFQFALQNLDWDYLIQMDADFSHDPQDLFRIKRELQKSHVIVGSRHIKYSRLEYPWFRKALSFFANTYAKIILDLPIHDCTGGFKGYRKEVIAKIINERYYSSDYAFQTELLFYIKKHGFKVKEIPIVFRDRQKGVSKMSAGNVIDGFWGVIKVKMRSMLKK